MNKKIAVASRWSLITEIFVKLLQPITNAVLARLLVPESFGLVATINMIIGFTDIFTDAGFQKYIIQHEFTSDTDRDEYTNVAFWSNLGISLLFLVLIVLFKEPIASMTGVSNLANGIAIAAFSLPITSFSSIQMAIFRRNLDFKTLFIIRMIGAFVPVVVTIPLTLIFRNYWSLVIGTLCGNAITSILLTILSTWKPKLTYSWSKFNKMFSFCYWILIESILIWLTSYIGIFIVGKYMSSYYLGLYKTSMTTVTQIMSLITAATTPVIFSAISRLQHDRKAMNKLFIESLKLVSFLLIPLGIGILLYKDTVTLILLGGQWKEATDFIGLFGLCNALGLVLASYWDSMFNAIGKPKYSVLTQIIYLGILIPMLLWGANKGFIELYSICCYSRIVYIVIQLIAVKILLKIDFTKSIGIVIPAITSSVPMVVIGIVQQSINNSLLCNIIGGIMCIVTYFLISIINPLTKNEVINILNSIRNRGLPQEKE